MPLHKYVPSPPSGAMMNDRGNYLTVWRKMPNGEWKIVVAPL
jgi:ketosteroid isomerase-like protein